MKYFFTLICLFLSFGIDAQINTIHQFEDEGHHRLQRIFQADKQDNGIIISGRMSNANSEIPILLKLNSEGEVLWSTGSCLEKALYHIQEVSFLTSEDGFVYVIANFSQKTLFSINNVLTSRFYKIDATTGAVMWESEDVSDNRPNAQHRFPNHFVDLSPSRIVLGFNDNNYKGYVLDKNTGEILDVYEKNLSVPSLITDHNQNFIYYQGGSLYKCNQQDFDAFLWQTEVPQVDKIYEDKFGDLYVFCTSGVVKKIDVTLGHEIWSTRAAISSDTYIADLKETNEYFYLSYNYRGQSHYNISKVNKVTGELVWESFEIIEEINSITPSASGHSRVNSIDLDYNGDLLLSGQYASDTSGKVGMGLMKINSDDGSKMQEAVIKINQNVNSEKSLFTGVFDDKVLFVGTEIEWLYEEFLSRPVLVQTDLDLNTSKQEDLPSGFKYDSGVIQMLPIQNITYLLEQKGAEVEIVKRTEDGNTLWSTTLDHDVYNQADYLAIGDDFVYASTRGIVGENTELILYKIAAVDGSLVDKVIVSSSEPDPSQTYELEVADDVAYLYYSNFPYNAGFSVLVIHKWSGGAISDPSYQNVNELFLDKEHENLVINYGEDLFLIDNTVIHSVNKNSLVVNSNYYSGDIYFFETRNTLQNDNIVYLYGNDIYSEKQYVLKYNLATRRAIWSKTYDNIGTLNKLILGEDDYLYAMGKTDDMSNLMKISDNTGEQVWNRSFLWPSDVINEEELNFNFDVAENKIVRYFASEKNNTEKYLYLRVYDTSGNVINEVINETVLGGIEDYLLSISTNGSLLIGGQYPQDCGSQSSGVLMYMVNLEYEDDDNDGVTNDKDLCSNTPIDEQANAEGCSLSQLDDDNDGVTNDKDQCSNTPLNTAVDIKGCIIFPENNLNIQTIGETCSNKNNAKIIISAHETHNYTANLNGTEYNFTTDLTIDNLTSGNHELCITVSSEFYEQCYTIALEEGTTISGKLSSSKSGQVSINIEKGTAPYSIFVNGNVVSQTELSSFSVNASHGDVIEIGTSKVCEGKLSKKVYLTGEISAYPNPTNGGVEVNLPITTQKEVIVKLYTIQSQLISTHSYQVKNGKVNLSLKNQPKGIYLAKFLTKEPVLLKILKK
jgi:hypothetical protein